MENWPGYSCPVQCTVRYGTVIARAAGRISVHCTVQYCVVLYRRRNRGIPFPERRPQSSAGNKKLYWALYCFYVGRSDLSRVSLSLLRVARWGCRGNHSTKGRTGRSRVTDAVHAGVPEPPYDSALQCCTLPFIILYSYGIFRDLKR